MVLIALSVFVSSVAAVPPAPEALIERDSLEKRVTHQGMVSPSVLI